MEFPDEVPTDPRSNEAYKIIASRLTRGMRKCKNCGAEIIDGQHQ